MDEEKDPIEIPETPDDDYAGCGCGCEVDDEAVKDMLDEVFGKEDPEPPPEEPPDEPVEPEPPLPSILQDVKKWVGIVREYEVFDSDILMHINAAFFTLFELGVGPREGFALEDGTEDWPEFSEDKIVIAAVKQYVLLKVRNAFDPPTSSYVLNSNQSKIEELEWRLRELCGGFLDYESEDEVPDDPIPEEPPEEQEPSEPTPPDEPSDDEDCSCGCETATDEEVNDMLDKIFDD